MTTSVRPPIWTRAYTLLCSAVFLSQAQYSILIVVIPLYVDHLGHSAFLAGLVLLAFSLPSFSLRPFIGYWADSWSTVGVLSLGALLLSASSLIYLIPSFAVLFLASAARGIGWAGLMTGGYTLLAHMTPPTRRGEASGYYSSISGAATLLFPAVGLWLLTAPMGGYRTAFIVAAGFSLLSATIGFFGLRPLIHFSPSLRRPDGAGAGPAGGIGSGIIDKGVLLATALNASMNLAQPAITAFLPLYARHQGIHGIAFFYVVSGISDLTVRPTLGRVSDRFGRGYSIVPAFAAQIAAVALIVTWGSLPAILLAGVLNAAGSAVNGATTMALAMDLANPLRRGAAMATYSLSFQMGAGIGSVLAGGLVTAVGFRGMYWGSMLILAGGLLLALANWRRIAHVIPVAA
jgi:MFS family permease